MTRKLIRELRREFPFAELSRTNHGHYRLRLPNGRVVFIGSTPSCRYFLVQARANVRRQMEAKEARP